MHPFVFDMAIVPGEHGSVTRWHKTHGFQDLDGWDEFSPVLSVYVAF